jgi:hypothetical protein
MSGQTLAIVVIVTAVADVLTAVACWILVFN